MSRLSVDPIKRTANVNAGAVWGRGDCFDRAIGCRGEGRNEIARGDVIGQDVVTRREIGVDCSSGWPDVAELATRIDGGTDRCLSPHVAVIDLNGRKAVARNVVVTALKNGCLCRRDCVIGLCFRCVGLCCRNNGENSHDSDDRRAGCRDDAAQAPRMGVG